jgi:hypothetical protein
MAMTPFPARFYRFAALCSFATVLSTLVLIFAPRLFPPVDGIDARMALVHDPVYQLRAWTYLLHPFIVFLAALGVGLRLRREAAVPVLLGLLGFALWATTEAAQQAMTLMAFDRWRVAWADADAALRALIVERTALYDAAWDAMYFLLLVGFAIGNGAYAWALRSRGRFDRVLALFYLGAMLLTLSLISAEAGGPSLPAAVGVWLYPAIQPLGRTLIGIWLWREARDDAPATNT